MAEWIYVDDQNRFPPICINVLIFLQEFRKDSGYLWEERMIVGFYADEELDGIAGWYQDRADGHYLIIDDPFIRVVAWTLLPCEPTKNKLKKINMPNNEVE